MSEQLIKIKEYTIMKSGGASKVIALPKIWMNDNNVDCKSRLDMYRANIDGKDVLVIAKQTEEKKNKKSK
jgi:hypothetical protein